MHTITIAAKIAIPAYLDCLVPINTSDILTIITNYNLYSITLQRKIKIDYRIILTYKYKHILIYNYGHSLLFLFFDKKIS